MAIQNIPLWPFEPNWSASLTEVLEWLTDVMTSPSGSEQRRALRIYPRRSFEYSLAVGGNERSLFDNLMTAFGAQRWYFPLWHDANFTEAAIPVGGKTVVCSTAESSKIKPGTVAVLMGESPYDTELVEIETVTTSGMTLVNGVTRTWLPDTRIFAVAVSKLTDEPEPSKQSNATITAQVRFQIVEAHPEIDNTFSSDTYLGWKVLTQAPDERSALNSGIERMLVELDNQTSLPRWRDTANRPFTYEQYAWALEGREELAEFEGLLYYLQGRCKPIWVPTFMEDMVLAQPVAANTGSLVIERCGFTQAGGPRPDRQDIMIETLSGRIYRRITASAFNAQGQEVILLDQNIPSAIQPRDVVNICFMTLMRLNQDSITIEHHTDTDGASMAIATFRSAPDTRIPLAASF